MNNNISATSSVNFTKEFMDFLKKFGVIGLAIGVVVGGAVTKLIGVFTDTILTPIITLIFSKIGNLKPGQLPNLGVPGLDIAALIAGFINFAVLMFVVFVTVKFILNKFISKEELDAMK